MMRSKCLGWVLLMAWGTVPATANAQTTPPPAKPQAAKKKAVPTKGKVAPQAQPDLEPRAVEILKAVSSRLVKKHEQEGRLKALRQPFGTSRPGAVVVTDTGERVYPEEQVAELAKGRRRR
jgi:hypothetical protein